jgi:hypothetical protein
VSPSRISTSSPNARGYCPKLLEVDPRGRKARWTGIDERPRGIAAATRQAVRARAVVLARQRTEHAENEAPS